MAQQGIRRARAQDSRRNPSGRQGNPALDLDRWKPSAGDPWDTKKAAHLLRRAGFGGSPEEIQAVVTLGMDRTVDILLTPSTAPVQETGSRILPNGEVLNLTYDLGSQRAQWLYEMVYSFYPLREKLALFFHDHFSVGSDNFFTQPLLVPHTNVFRRHGLGDFKTLLIEVTKDPAMLHWLDNAQNGQPNRQTRMPQVNENYGRELFELYTMSVNGGYTQADVVAAAEALSGWSLAGYNVFAYRDSYHIAGVKTVLGSQINNGTGAQGQRDVYDLIDIILAWPATADYLVTKIWEYFVAEDPDPALVSALAARFRTDGYNIRSLMSLILRSNFFYDAGSAPCMRTLVKNPVEYAIGCLRNSGLTVLGNYRGLGSAVEVMGLPLLRYQTPSGLDDGVAWIDSSSLMQRANLADSLTAVGGAQLQSQFNPFREVLRLGLNSAQAIVDHYLDIMVDGDAPNSWRQALYQFMDTNLTGGAAQFSATNQTHVNQKVRGLFHLIASSAQYQMN